VLTAEAYDRSQNKLLTKGSVSTLDNQIDTSTGTVKLRGIFQNENNVLFPNQFVNIKLLVNTIKNSMVVPTAAVQQGNKGAFVYLLKKEPSTTTQVKNKDKKENSKKVTHRVFIKPVKVLVTNDNESAIEGDVLPGQLVVTEGGDKLTENSLVHTVNEQKNFAPYSNSEEGKEALKHDIKKEVNEQKQSFQDIYTKPRMRAVHRDDIKASKYFLLDIDPKFRDLDFRAPSHFNYTRLINNNNFIHTYCLLKLQTTRDDKGKKGIITRKKMND
jgi:multidrug efflux system membrane fusion protein